MISKIRKLASVLLCLLNAGVPLYGQHCDGCTKNGIDIPVSLAAGTVRTPRFAVKGKYYNIVIEAKWHLPTDELRCRMGFALSPSDNHCKWETLLETRWRVLDGDRVVADGYDRGRTGDFDADRNSLGRYIGGFKGEDHHWYVVELTFMKNASVLNVTEPRLIVESPGFSF